MCCLGFYRHYLQKTLIAVSSRPDIFSIDAIVEEREPFMDSGNESYAMDFTNVAGIKTAATGILKLLVAPELNEE